MRLAAGGPALVEREVAGGVAELGIRPDAIAVADTGLPATVVLVERLGGSSLLHARVNGLAQLVTVELPGTYEAAAGTPVHLGIDGARAHLFDSEGRAL